MKAIGASLVASIDPAAFDDDDEDDYDDDCGEQDAGGWRDVPPPTCSRSPTAGDITAGLIERFRSEGSGRQCPHV